MNGDGGRERRGGQGEAVERGRGCRVGRGRREGVRVSQGKRVGVGEPRRSGRRRLVVWRQVGDHGGRRRGGQGDGQVWGGVVGSRWQEAHEVKAAGVEAGATPGPHHQDLLGVVV